MASQLGQLFFISFILTIANLVPSTFTLILITPPFCLPERGNFTNGSSYQSNLNSLLTSFSNNTVEYGFYHSSAGEVTGIGFCRGDIGPEACCNCMNTSSHELRRECPNSKEAIIYYDICTLRYSNRSIFGSMEVDPNHQQPNGENFWDVIGSTQALTKLLRRLQNEAASNSGGNTNLWKYATGEVEDFETIYAAVQCSPDLAEQQCRNCLDEILKIIPVHMKGKRGGKVMAPTCNFRFEIYPFYDQPLIPHAPSPSPSNFHPFSAPPPPPPINIAPTGKGMYDPN